MFLGNYHHNLQDKKRLAIPADFRGNLGEDPIITRGIDNCLNILPFNIWNEMTNNLGNNPLVNADKRNLRRLLAHEAYKVEFDSQGRIVIPQSLIEWAQLEKKVVVAGSINWIELWNLELYKEYMETIKSDTGSIAERITDQ